MRNVLIGVVALACFLAVSVANSPGEAEEAVQLLQSPDSAVRAGASITIARERRSTIKRLTDMAGSWTDPYD